MCVQNTFSTSKVIKVFKRNLHQLLTFSVLSAENSAVALAVQVIGAEHRLTYKDAYRRSVATEEGYYGYLVVDCDIRNKFVEKYRLRNFFCTFNKKRNDLKSLTRDDLCLYQLHEKKK